MIELQELEKEPITPSITLFGHRAVNPFNVKKFLNECCTRVHVEGREYKITHKVDGRLIRSIPSIDSIKKDYFIIKLADPNLFQRYMIVIREKIPGFDNPRSNVLRYEETLKNCELFLEGK